LWRRMFAGARDVLGRTLIVNGRPYSIIGVMPVAFDPTDSHEDLWVPSAYSPAQLAVHDEHFLTVVGRLKPGVTIAAAQREMDEIARQLGAEFPQTNKGNGVRIQSLTQAIIGDYRLRLFVVLGAVAPVPWRAREAEALLKGQTITEDLALQAAAAAVKNAKPMTQNAYKIQLTRVALQRALLKVAGLKA